MNRLGLKLGCLLVAVVVWIQVAADHQVQQTLYLPLELVNLGEGLTLAGNTIPDLVQVRLEGSKLSMLAHLYLNRLAGRVVVDLGNEGPGPPFVREVTVNDVLSGHQVLAVAPPVRLHLQVDHEISRSVPVVVPTTGRLTENLRLLAAPAARPDSVVLVGPARFFAGGERVTTEPVDLSRLKQDLREQRRAVLPHRAMTCATDQVEVIVRLATVESRTFPNVPVVPLRDAGQPEAVVHPEFADVILRGPADLIRSVQHSRIGVTVSLSGLPVGIHHLRGQVDKPDSLEFVSIEPETFMAIIGDVSPEEGSEGP